MIHRDSIYSSGRYLSASGMISTSNVSSMSKARQHIVRVRSAFFLSSPIQACAKIGSIGAGMFATRISGGAHGIALLWSGVHEQHLWKTRHDLLHIYLSYPLH